MIGDMKELISVNRDQPASQEVVADDRILLATRWVAALLIPVLLLAFAILVFVPEQTGARFAWQIRPPMTAALMGTGYLGGAYFFLRVATGKRWHRVSAGFPAVTAFTWFMLAATILHWDRFSHGRLGFQLWLVLYVVTPLLVPWLWWRNRVSDPRTPDPDDLPVPQAARWILAVAGAAFLSGTAILFLWPSLAIANWPWTLTPLTARVVAGWLALMGVGSLAISRERRWSAWRTEVESIVLWQAVMLVLGFVHLGDFTRPFNWYLVGTAAGLAGTVAIYVTLEGRRRATLRRQQPLAVAPGDVPAS
jgi:hypothetical protein